ncbi:MAG: hypothetical protein E7632_07530 [Ruminococcaceae bacterium]|nr:hypothetical protein [Oscillospiraceae bacterium]
MKKQLAYILLLAMAAQLAACGETPGAGADSTTASTDTTTAEVTTSLFNPDLPDKDYGGHQFRLLSSDEIGSGRYSYEIDAEAENGETINDAVFRRNSAVEDRFNVEIVKVEVNKSQTLNTFKSSVMANDDAYDVLVDEWVKTLSIAHEYCLEIDDLPYIDIENDWWEKRVIMGAAIGGRAFGLTGDINIVDDKLTWGLMFNKNLADEYLDVDLYQTVRDGKWTIDALEAACKGVQNDLNGDTVYDDKDQWGFVGSGNAAMTFLWAGGGIFGNLEDDGSVTLTLDSQRNLDVLERTFDFYSDPSLVYHVEKIKSANYNGTTSYHARSRQMFNFGQILFIAGTLSYSEEFRDMEDEFGFLPYPKYDEAQKEYITVAQEGGATMFSVPRSAPDAERTSILLDAMCSTAKVYITPAFYDVYLQRKIARDNDSAEMLDIIFDSRVFDIVYSYDFGSIKQFNKVMIATSNTIASKLASYKNAAQKAYETTYSEILALE